MSVRTKQDEANANMTKLQSLSQIAYIFHFKSFYEYILEILQIFSFTL